MSKDPLKEYLKDPDRRAKLFLLMTGGMILSTVLITIGTIILILLLLGII
ncbi:MULTISPECIES: hypothetical protein [Methanothermobacter]|jgi:prolipoprotein diacylglyceryltransferase|uniref:Uncharacterized protein n=3 Tax=Methanobacteriaceae TaxID=2159 RepID=A0A371ND21_9EURY|nr:MULTISPECIES: hypothetical protein [Methanothermobacter]MBC7111192.1 hypothetical protein [Methanothermobacter sp.]MCQ8905357.1 hypothetical protein [Methanothermobacter sp.]MDI9618126.1 hypothetical protein [Methanothermobacter sp.]MDK2875450.1 hypothetical protein [Methanothermobacter sp.]MDN5374536.1 hypothetical protein [Methanothermobacter sp.]